MRYNLHLVKFILFFLNVCLYYFKFLFIYFWLCWVFLSVQGLSLVAASGGHSSSRCAGLSLSRPLLLRSTGSSRTGSVVVAHGPSRSTACGILPDQGSNPCPLHWQADSQPLRHQGNPTLLKYISMSFDRWLRYRIFTSPKQIPSCSFAVSPFIPVLVPSLMSVPIDLLFHSII